MKILVASNNPKKREEVERILLREGDGPSWEVLAPRDLDLELEPEEDGDTFEANSALKARAFSRLVDLMVLADDSGLAVDALGGAPGVRSARFAGPDADDQRNRLRLLEALADEPEERRRARFVCVATLARRGHVLSRARGELEGRILTEERGEGGFGYDPLFYLPSLGRTLAELTPTEKDAVSHRGRALRKLIPSLRIREV